ncbi:hypothetical protein [Celerinatantimonas sp. YJH-8]|uniref:hypothetical protein n=1 Tax=Celerinatantimonas sp. YJH-8 TaxID=3228714 RepID=UPI0038C19446
MQIDNKLILEIGQLLLASDCAQEDAWDFLSVVFDVSEGHIANSGFLYAGSETEPFSTGIDDSAMSLDHKIQFLREQIYQQTGSKFKQLLVQMKKATGQIKIQFEFDDPQRWSFSPKNLATIKEVLRPDFS